MGICDAAGRLLAFSLVPGQAHELALSLRLLDRLLEPPDWALTDVACDAREFRWAAQAVYAVPIVPSRKGAKEPQPCPSYVCQHRNLIERCWACLQERRAVATRYDKTAACHAAGVAIAASLDWIESIL